MYCRPFKWSSFNDCSFGVCSNLQQQQAVVTMRLCSPCSPDCGLANYNFAAPMIMICQLPCQLPTSKVDGKASRKLEVKVKWDSHLTVASRTGHP